MLEQLGEVDGFIAEPTRTVKTIHIMSAGQQAFLGYMSPPNSAYTKPALFRFTILLKTAIESGNVTGIYHRPSLNLLVCIVGAAISTARPGHERKLEPAVFSASRADLSQSKSLTLVQYNLISLRLPETVELRLHDMYISI